MEILNHRLDLPGMLSVGLDRENQNARRTADSNARHRTHDQHRCRICPPPSNWGGATACPNRLFIRPSQALADRQPKSTVTEHPRCRSDDQSTAITSSASIAAGAARCLDGISTRAIG
jgi:hypothetical protein